MALTNQALRNDLKREVDEKLSSGVEIRPYFTAWEIICDRFNGVALLDDSLDPVPYVHDQLKAEMRKTDMVTEEVFLSWLISLPALTKNITNADTGEVWEPIYESFNSFSDGAKTLKVSDVKGEEFKLKEYYSWIVGLCDWTSSSFGATKISNVH